MKRDRLIPVEKSKKVIYLDPRGRGVDQKHYGAMALYVLAVLCALYCVGIGLFVGFGSYFFLIWGVIAAFCAAWGWILTHKSVQERIPRWIRMTFCGLVAAGILLLLILEGIDSCIRKISFHTLRFADRLVITLSTGHDDFRLRIGIQVFYGFIQTFLQYIAGAGSLPLSSQYDDVVRSRLCFRAKLPEDHSF